MPNFSRFHIATPTAVPYTTSPVDLMRLGLNLLTNVSEAGIFRQPSQPVPSTLVYAHFDTGAARTMIDRNLATHLGLVTTGNGGNFTAGGAQITPNYCIDLNFLEGPGIAQLRNWPVGSCTLPFNLQNSIANPSNPNQTEFGILIGRDIMANWVITWHGPSSTVFISD